MIGRDVKTRLLAFVVIALLGVSYVGARYVGLGARLLGGDYSVSADFASSGGIFEGAQVTYRGVVVGSVSGLRLGSSGVRVDLHIDRGWRIPADALAVVSDRSAVGEQYLDLEPATSSGPFLHEGSRIPRASTRTPLPTAVVLRDVDRLVQSVDRAALVTVVDELDSAFSGTGPDLERLLDSGDALVTAAQQNLPQTVALLTAARTVLATQQAEGSALRTFSAGLADLTDTLAASDHDIRTVLAAGPPAASRLTTLLTTNRTALGALLANLVTTGQVVTARLPGIRQLLVTYPAVVAAGYTVVPGDGTAHFGLVLNVAQPPSCTAGYGGTRRRVPSDTSDAPPNTAAGCTAPRGSGIDVRGAQNAPGGSSGQAVTSVGGASLSGGSGGDGPTGAGAAYVAAYDPVTGRFAGPSGAPLAVTADGGPSQVFGGASWMQLLVGPLAR